MTQNILERQKYSTKGHGHHDAASYIELAKKFINEHNCPELEMDISHLNIIDAGKVAVLCSTYHYAKYPHGELTWKVNSSEVRNIIKPLSLGNMKLIT